MDSLKRFKGSFKSSKARSRPGSKPKKKKKKKKKTKLFPRSNESRKHMRSPDPFVQCSPKGLVHRLLQSGEVKGKSLSSTSLKTCPTKSKRFN